MIIKRYIRAGFHMQKEPPPSFRVPKRGDIQLIDPLYHSHPERGILGSLSAKQRHSEKRTG